MLNNIIFQIFYYDKIQLSNFVNVNQSKIIIRIHQEIFNIKESMILINLTNIKNYLINFIKLQLNVSKIWFIWKFIKRYVLRKVETLNIIILSKYLKQCDLLKHFIFRDFIIARFKILIIDVYHDKKMLWICASDGICASNVDFEKILICKVGFSPLPWPFFRYLDDWLTQISWDNSSFTYFTHSDLWPISDP